MAKPAGNVELTAPAKGAYTEEEENLAATAPVYNDVETKRILRKMDWHLLPLLTLLYILSYMDRGNLGNAKVAGMNDDLGLSGKQYNMVLTVFFFPYALLEVPSNIVLKFLPASLWLSIQAVSWGAVMTLHGIVKGYHGLLAARIFLGVTEAGFFPAATFLITTWYCRYETQTRMAVFYTGASLAGAFSGLLAFAIQKMDGLAGLEGWRWIFIIEGIFTVAVGFSVYFLLPDRPATAKFLTPPQRDFVRGRLAADSGTSEGQVETEDRFKWRYFWAAVRDWRVYVGVVVCWGNSICIYSFSYTAPTVIFELGYTAAQAQLLTIPIYVVSALSTLATAWFADKHRTRWPAIVGPFCIAAVGFLALLAIPHPRYPGLTYAFLFCIPAGVLPPIMGLLSWFGNNLAPSSKRAVAMALALTISNLGGTIGSNIYLEKQKPKYQLGYGFSLGIVCASIMATFVLRWSFMRSNKQRDALDQAEIREKYTSEQLLAMGDRSPLFRYVI